MRSSTRSGGSACGSCRSPSPTSATPGRCCRACSNPTSVRPSATPAPRAPHWAPRWCPAKALCAAYYQFRRLELPEARRRRHRRLRRVGADIGYRRRVGADIGCCFGKFERQIPPTGFARFRCATPVGSCWATVAWNPLRGVDRKPVPAGLRFGGRAYAGPGRARPTSAARIALTTDSYVVNPLFFPGGEHRGPRRQRTINDLACSGAQPIGLTAGFILEEGLELEVLGAVAEVDARAAAAAGRDRHWGALRWSEGAARTGFSSTPPASG